MDIIGNIKSRTAVDQKTEKFRVQEFVLDASYFDNYNQQNRENFLPFQVTGKKIEEFAKIPDGARVKVFFALQGRYFEKRDGSGQGLALNLSAYRFEVINLPSQQQAAASSQHPQSHGNLYA